MEHFDFCLAWNWPYDSDFRDLLDRACQNRGISLLQVSPENLSLTLELLHSRELSFQAFFDRASDTDERFLSLAAWAGAHAGLYLNPLIHARRAWDKAGMHAGLLSHGMPVPPAVIIPSFEQQPELPKPDLSVLSGRFAIKPAHGGGGRGVISCASEWEQVLEARRQFPCDLYLLQAYVEPAWLESRPAWFRVIHCGGSVFPCWWDPYTHDYTPVEGHQLEAFSLQPLVELALEMARLCGLDLFSTEIALTSDGCYWIIDYVNDPIDLRPQSTTAQGVPDAIVAAVCHKLADMVACGCQPQWSYFPFKGSRILVV